MRTQRLSHAYLLVGAEGDALDAEAVRLAASIVCTGSNPPCGECRDCRKAFSHIHPDIITVGREPGSDGKMRQSIVVDQIRSVIADSVIVPNEAAYKVYIFREADRMNIAAQNALLKSLEEPAGHSCYILCAASAEAMLPTVRSRCRQQLVREIVQTDNVSDDAAEFLRLAGQKDLAGFTLRCMQMSSLERADTESFLEDLYIAAADALCGRSSYPGLDMEALLRITQLAEQMKDWVRHNMSSKQIFSVLAIKTIEKTKG